MLSKLPSTAGASAARTYVETFARDLTAWTEAEANRLYYAFSGHVTPAVALARAGPSGSSEEADIAMLERLLAGESNISEQPREKVRLSRQNLRNERGKRELLCASDAGFPSEPPRQDGKRAMHSLTLMEIHTLVVSDMK
ncbi:MAG TPA: hypothetical protein VG963_11905 [Polyangiaceae bacterium]|nr:hypothetical protein [Polyangiaceae bacterium]